MVIIFIINFIGLVTTFFLPSEEEKKENDPKINDKKKN
jgi:hypothetical protein